MLFPVKFCLPAPPWFHRMVRVTVGTSPWILMEDPLATGHPDSTTGRVRFSQAVAVLGSGTTWKSTEPDRHPLTDSLIANACVDSSPVILDVGVSDGITSLDLIETLGARFRAYYATDVSFRAESIEANGRLYVYSPERECVLVCTRQVIFHSQTDEAIPPFAWIARRAIERAPVFDERSARTISLINPGLRRIVRSDPRVRAQEHSVFNPWVDEQPQIIKVANVLNRAYFGEDRLRLALRNLRDALSDGGMLFLTDNRHVERVSVFARHGNALRLTLRHNGGSEITSLALSIS